MSEPEAPKAHLLAPSGVFITRVMTHTFQSAHVDSVDPETARVDDYHSGGFPDMEIFTLGDDQLVVDEDGWEWLCSHCRLIVADFDPDEYDDRPISAWPDQVQDWCRRIKELGDVVRCVEDAKSRAPKGFCDTTTVAVLDAVVTLRCTAEIEALQARVDAYRKTDPRVILPNEEDEDEEASTCRTEGCSNDPDDGEGYDGFCGGCADAKA